MKKTTLFITLLLSFGLFAQVYTSGVVPLTTGYTAKIDVTEDVVTLTLEGPSTGWLGIAFNASSMNSMGEDVVIFDGTNFSDRTFIGSGSEPILDTSQDWTVVSNTVDDGVRTVIGTRARETGDGNDHTFAMSATSLNLVWARRLNNFIMGYHGAGACGATSTTFALGTEEMKIDSFKIYPNPANGYTAIELPANVNSGNIKIYDTLGRVVRNQTVTKSENTISTDELSAGSYIVVLRTEYGNGTKTLIVE